MSVKQIGKYGEWKSPVTSELISSASVSLVDLRYDGPDLYWTEMRPTEAGRQVIVRADESGKAKDITPAPYHARSKVHEYGGASFASQKGTVYFANFADQKLYRQDNDGAPVPLTKEGKLRFADFELDHSSRFMVSVIEDHSQAGKEPSNFIGKVDLKTGEVTALVTGNDFYASPKISPDGKHLAWMTWNHPNMPWDSSELWLADLSESGEVSSPKKVAGEPLEAINEPTWSPEGTLYFVSDRTGWWNIYRLQNGEPKIVCEKQAEFTGPLWVLGTSSYGFLSEAEIVCAYVVKGMWTLGKLNVETGALLRVDLPFTEIRNLRVGRGKVGFVAGSPTEPWSLIEFDPKRGTFATLKKAFTVDIDKKYFSGPRPIEFPTEGGTTAYGFFYPPTSLAFEAVATEKPPLVVMSHGGPTGATATALSLAIQYWTTRGFGVLDVNYGGSTGYGTKYRRRLNGQWGIVDVMDCIKGAQYLVDRGEADGNRLAIRGGSAGGYTTLAAITFHNTFKAGTSYYGISDIEMLAKDTHKFESRYDNSLVGPYPERRDLFVARSPIHFVDKISCPLLLLQGLDDKVVPPNQAEAMYQAVKAKGIAVSLIMFSGEDHGFRKRENIKKALDSELYFYSKVFKFQAADPIEPIKIDNL